MLILQRIFLIAATLAITVVPAVATSIDREKPSNFAVWAFLALCGLVIVAQVLPLIRSVNQEAKLLASKSREKKKLEAR